MVVWRGLGILAIFIPGFALAIPKAFESQAPRSGTTLTGLAFLVGGIGIWFLGRALNGRALLPGVGKKVFGSENYPSADHTLYGVPMEYWGLIWLVAGIVTTAIGISHRT